MSSDHAADVAEYVDGVITGRIVTGRLARLAVWRYLDDLKFADARGFKFDPDCATEFLNFSEMCCHTQGEWAGKPFVSEPWQKFIDWNLFGWRRKSDGMRRFRKDFECVARKNGKTSRCGPKCFYLSMMDNPVEEGGQGYCVATKEDQAKLLFDEIKRCIGKSPWLRDHCKIFQRRIVFPKTQSYMQVLGSDSDSQDGFNPHFIIRDELHAWQERHRGLKEKLDTGFGSRRQPLTITITTSGDDNSTIWMEEHEYAVRVLESVITGEIIDDTLFAFIACMDNRESMCFRCLGDDCPWCGGTGLIPADDPFDEAIWPKANPNLGVSLKLERLREAANEAKNKPSAMNQWLRYHCNVQVASTERAVEPELWAACAGDLSFLDGRECHAGIDLGRSNDFAAVTLVFPIQETDDSGDDFTRYEVKSWSWTCEGRNDDVKTEQIGRWIREKQLHESWGETIEIGDVRDKLLACKDKYSILTTAFDPNFAKLLAEHLQNDHGMNIFPFTQAPKFYNEPLRRLLTILKGERTVNGRKVRLFLHDGDPVLGWQASNLIIRKNQRDEWMPDKGGSPYKIDAMVALLMALSECMFGEKDAGWNYVAGSLTL